MTDNPLLQIRFAVPFDRIRAEHVEPAIEHLLGDAKAAIERIAADDRPRTYASTIGALDEATETLEWAMGLVSHLEAVATTAPLRAAYNAVQPAVAEFESSIPLHAGLWSALVAYAGTDEARGLDPTRARHLEKLMDSFRRHGAELDDAGKKRLTALDIELAQETTKFSQNVLDSTNAWELVLEDPARIEGLPPSAELAARTSAQERGVAGWRFTLQAPSYIPLMTHLDDASIREQAYRAFNTRASKGDHDNSARLGRILALRADKARLLGYRDFADLVLENRMAHTGAEAQRFVDELRERCEAPFVRENEDLLAFRRSLEGDDAPPLQPWDVAYYAEKQRKALYDFDEEELRPYFSLQPVMEGMFEIVSRLYGIRIEPAADLPTWDPAVRCFSVLDGDTRLGAFYVDVFPRDTKRGGAWMHPLLTGKRSASRREPHLGLICGNMTPPIGDRPALLSHREVETLFHEFGHLMHHLLSEVEVPALAGTNVAWDFVELPSQIMENWCWEREALDVFARHHETGEPIPEALFGKLRRARAFRAANAMMRQLGFAEVDLRLHTRYDPEHDADPVVYAREVAQAYSPAPLFEGYAMVTGFTHLFAHPVGYAAGYYSYKWAEVLDADAFTRFLDEGILSSTVGRRFRDMVLARGDSEDPAQLYRRFMGRGPDVAALLDRFGLAASATG